MRWGATLTLVISLSGTVAPLPPLPQPIASPPATQVMVEAVTAYRAQVAAAWLHDLNGPYREARPIRVKSVEPRHVAPPGGNIPGTPTTPTPAVGGKVCGVMGTDVEQWRPLVETYFGANTDRALAVMKCESGGNPEALNCSASAAAGLFQFVAAWYTGQWGGGAWDPFDPVENVARAAALSDGGNDWSHWECRPNGTVVQLQP